MPSQGYHINCFMSVASTPLESVIFIEIGNHGYPKVKEPAAPGTRSAPVMSPRIVTEDSPL